MAVSYEHTWKTPFIVPMRLSALCVGFPSASTKPMYTWNGGSPSVVPMMLAGCPKAIWPRLTRKHTKKLYALNCERLDGCFNSSSDMLMYLNGERLVDQQMCSAQSQRRVYLQAVKYLWSTREDMVV
jgi:hypothetical protein